MSTGESSDVSILLAQLEASVARLEQGTQELNEDIDLTDDEEAQNGAVLREYDGTKWTFEGVVQQNKIQETNHGFRRSLKRSNLNNDDKERGPAEQGHLQTELEDPLARYKTNNKAHPREGFSTPAPGHYNPEIKLVKPRPPSVKMMLPSGKSRKRQPLTSPSATLPTQECLSKSLAASSRIRRAPGLRWVKSSEEDKKQMKPERKETPGVGDYNLQHTLVEKRVKGVSFAKPQALLYKNSCGKEDDASKTEVYEKIQQLGDQRNAVSLEPSYQAIEPRVKGVTSWRTPSQLVYVGCSKTAYKSSIDTPNAGPTIEETQAEEESNVFKAWESVQPHVAAVAWAAPAQDQYRPRHMPDSGVDGQLQTEQNPLSSIDRRVEPTTMQKYTPVSSGFAPAVPPSKQLLARQTRDLVTSSKLGPGAHYIAEQFSTFGRDCVGPRFVDPKQTTKRRRPFSSEFDADESPAVGTYNINDASVSTRRRVQGGVSWAKTSKRWVKQASEKTKTSQHPNEQNENIFLNQSTTLSSPGACDNDLLSIHSYDSDLSSSSDWAEEKDARQEGKYNEDENGNDESTWSESEPDSDVGMDGLAQKLLASPPNCQSNGTKGPPPSSWARKSFQEEADPRRALILQRHLRQKRKEKRGPARILEPNREAIEPRRSTHIISMKNGEQSRAKQLKQNAIIQEKVLAVTMKKSSRANKLLAELGIDIDDLDYDSRINLNDTELQDPAKIKGFAYRIPSELPPQAIEARTRRELEEQYRGPGTYGGAAAHKAWLPEDDSENAYMGRFTGRERIHISKKGKITTVEFGAVHAEQEASEDADLGPGHYSVPTGVTRFGVEKVRGPDMDRMLTGSRCADQSEEIPDEGAILELNAPLVKERLRKVAPGERGFTFSKLNYAKRTSTDSEDKNEEGYVLDLAPDREKFKFERTQGIIPMDKMPERFQFSKKNGKNEIDSVGGVSEEIQLDLDAERGRLFIGKRSQTANLSAGPSRNLFPDKMSNNFSIEEGDEMMPAFADESTKDSLADAKQISTGKYHAEYLKPRTVRFVSDFSKGQDRFPTAADDHEPPLEYDIEAGLKSIKPRVISAVVDMGRQQNSKLQEEDREKYQDADYAGASEADRYLGGRNSKGVQRRKTAHKSSTVDMAKMTSRAHASKDHNKDAIQADLDLDVERGEACLRSNIAKGVLSMKKVRPRWADQAKAENKENCIDFVDIEALERGMEQLTMFGKSMHPKPKGNVDMSKRTGRQEKELPRDELTEIDARAARDAPSQNVRVTGGVIPLAQRTNSPKSGYARDVAKQGDILELNPDPTPLLKRTDIALAMDGQVGRHDYYNKVEDTESITCVDGMTSPHKPDLRAAESFLKPRVIGGAVGLDKEVPKPVLEKNKRSEATNQVKLRQSEAALYSEKKLQLKFSRKEELARSTGEWAEKEKRRKARAAAKALQPKLKYGNPIQRAQKVL